MTFWNRAYFHYYGYGSIWHLLEKKLAKQRKSHIRGMISALGIRRWRKYRNKKMVKLKDWKHYGINIKVKYG